MIEFLLWALGIAFVIWVLSGAEKFNEIRRNTNETEYFRRRVEGSR